MLPVARSAPWRALGALVLADLGVFSKGAVCLVLAAAAGVTGCGIFLERHAHGKARRVFAGVELVEEPPVIRRIQVHFTGILI